MRMTSKFGWLNQLLGVWHLLLETSRSAVAIHFASPWALSVEIPGPRTEQGSLIEPDPIRSLDCGSSEYREAA